MTAGALAAAVCAGDRRALAKAITLLEGARPEQRTAAAALLALLAPRAGGALRLGVSGSPGVGKSTFIEAFGARVVAAGQRLAVLAVDPSSPRTGGSILGDRVRMERLSGDSRVFIRPTPAGTTLGGAARHTREAIIACEAAGYGVVVVETVGVGQSETLVASMVDALVILHQPGAGDELQGIKRGLLELADLVAVTKADGDLAAAARRAQGELELALMLARGTGELPPVLLVSSVAGTGLAELDAALAAFVDRQRASGAFAGRRRQQAGAWFRSEIVAQLEDRLAARTDLADLRAQLEEQVQAGKAAATVAAGEVVRRFLGAAPPLAD